MPADWRSQIGGIPGSVISREAGAASLKQMAEVMNRTAR